MKNQTREEWLAERRQGIGGSDAAAVLGLSPWRTPVSVWLDKTGRAAPQPETEAMRIGTELEDYVARSYSRETGRKVTRFNHMIHDGCFLGNFDRLVVPEGQKVASHQQEVRTDTLLECKTASREWDDGVPVYYQTQVQFYLGLVPCLHFGDVAVLNLNHKHFGIYRLERDQAVIDHIRAYIRDWWERHIVMGEAPKPTNEADCKLLWARSNPGKTVYATDESVNALLEYNAAKADMDAAKAIADRAKDKVLAAIGDAESLSDPVTGKPLATWKSAKDTSKTDWEAIARELGATPEQIAAHTETKPGSRRFLVKTDFLMQLPSPSKEALPQAST